MDLIDKLRELSKRAHKLKESNSITSEEGTKNALIMPFIQALGYDVFDPSEVTPELTADVGTKKGEKVDYAILRDGNPIILIECKDFAVNLNKTHASQLYRYFSVTDVRFSILTNGIHYHFYSDLEEPNRMDEKPFYVFNLLAFNEADVDALKQFMKSAFDQDKIVNKASELKYRNAIKSFIDSQLKEPSERFIRVCLEGSYTGRFTQSAIDEFRPITRAALRSFIAEQVEKRLKSALATEEEKALADIRSNNSSETASESDETDIEEEKGDSDIVTTEEEIEAYNIVRSIIREVIDVSRIYMRDVQTYCSVLVDDNNRQTICRLWFNTSQKYLGILSEGKEEERHPIDSLDDIFQYTDQLKKRASHFVKDEDDT